jgi:hypothetical protein
MVAIGPRYLVFIVVLVLVLFPARTLCPGFALDSAHTRREFEGALGPFDIEEHVYEGASVSRGRLSCALAGVRKTTQKRHSGPCVRLWVSPLQVRSWRQSCHKALRHLPTTHHTHNARTCVAGSPEVICHIGRVSGRGVERKNWSVVVGLSSRVHAGREPNQRKVVTKHRDHTHRQCTCTQPNTHTHTNTHNTNYPPLAVRYHGLCRTSPPPTFHE